MGNRVELFTKSGEVKRVVIDGVELSKVHKVTTHGQTVGIHFEADNITVTPEPKLWSKRPSAWSYSPRCNFDPVFASLTSAAALEQSWSELNLFDLARGVAPVYLPPPVPYEAHQEVLRKLEEREESIRILDAQKLRDDALLANAEEKLRQLSLDNHSIDAANGLLRGQVRGLRTRVDELIEKHESKEQVVVDYWPTQQLRRANFSQDDMTRCGWTTDMLVQHGYLARVRMTRSNSGVWRYSVNDAIVTTGGFSSTDLCRAHWESTT